MYARITTFSMGPGSRQHAEHIADSLGNTYKNIPGLKSVTFLADWEACEYGSFQVWETKEAADAALPGIQKGLQELAAGKIVGTPVRRTYEIYEPKP